MRRILAAASFVLAACATSPSPAPPAEPAPSLEARMEADPMWQPGDVAPTAAQVAMWEPYACPPDAESCAMQIGVELRNRCGVPVRFLVGPRSETAPANAPVNELAPAQAIETWIPSDYALYLAGPDGAFSLRVPIGAALVFVGDGRCDHVYVDMGGVDEVVSLNQ